MSAVTQPAKGRKRKSKVGGAVITPESVHLALTDHLNDLRKRGAKRRTPTPAARTNTPPVAASAAIADEYADKINAAHKSARQHAESAVTHAIECGKLLVAVKFKLAHGGWLPWLKQHCPDISDRTAQGYMRVARAVTDPAKAQRVADLSLRNALQELTEGRKALVAVERSDRDATHRDALYAPVTMPDIKQTAEPNRSKSPLPEVADPLPITSPRASCAVEIPDEGEKVANGVDARAADLERVKTAITEYAKLYGWGAAQMDLIEWIEGQV